MEEIKCPVCFEIPPKEIYQCCNGHTVCSKCSEILTECPQCRAIFEYRKIRSRTLENVLDTMKFDCAYKSAGCDASLTREEHSSHLETCKFGGKSYKFCEYLGYDCDFLVDPRNIEETVSHLETTHNFELCHQKDDFQLHLEGLSGFGPESKRCWSPVVRSPDADAKRGCIVVVMVYNHEDDTISLACIYICTDTTKVKFSGTSINISVLPVNNLESPKMQWTVEPTYIEYANTAIHRPYLRIPRNILLDTFVKDDTITVHCSVEQQQRVGAPKTTTNESTAQRPSLLSHGNPGSVERVTFFGVKCDFCEQSPISGCRFKCLQCPDFDLCEVCVQDGPHGHHVFAVIRNKIQEAILASRLKSLFGERSYFPAVLTEKGSGYLPNLERFTECAKCHSDIKYLCLQCRPYNGYCEGCFWNRSNSRHVDVHVFAVVKSREELTLVLKFLPDRF